MSSDMKRASTGSAESTAPEPKKTKPFRISKLANIDLGSERNKICGTLVSVIEPRGQYGLVIGILKLEDGHAKIRAFREHGVRLHNTLKDAVGRHVTVRLVAAEMEGENYVDRSYGRLHQLIFSKPSEALVADDGYLDPTLVPPVATEPMAEEPLRPLLKLKDVVKPGLYSGQLHVQVLDKVTFFASPAKDQASTASTPRFGTAVTDGDHKAEAYFLFSEAKFYLPGQEFNILRFNTELVGRTLKVTVQQKYSIEKTAAVLQSNLDEDDFDYPPVVPSDDRATSDATKNEARSLNKGGDDAMSEARSPSESSDDAKSEARSSSENNE